MEFEERDEELCENKRELQAQLAAVLQEIFDPDPDRKKIIGK